MRFDVITIFPQMIDAYMNESIIKRAREKKLIQSYAHNLRDFSADKKHKKVDDRPYGGGAGMVLGVEALSRALDSILRIKNKESPKHSDKSGATGQAGIRKKTKVILFSASGKQFTQKMAIDWAKKYDQIVMIAGRYEGVDERIVKVLQATSYNLQAVSIGPYVLTGGELPALIVIDAVSRHIPGVLGSHESLEEKRHGIGVPVYTRPEVFTWRGRRYRVPKIL
ncbi:MAG: tRNA (guanosine(37)-N1)-methyltransferase TrmD, partial [Candidatus Sungbacteria bacterium]|nr:tRNA (guanosine(37)-N1)-methyltransferase TrmD [Candidatus Sungbacteria bacterium]